mgnify:CR=1 FL=1
MWLELAALGAGAIGYGARRQRRLPQTRAANLPAPRFRVQQLWRDIRDAMQAAGREQLQGEIDPQLQLRLENDRRKAKREQKLALGAMGVAVIGSYVPVLILFAAAAVLYLARESF